MYFLHIIIIFFASNKSEIFMILTFLYPNREMHLIESYCKKKIFS